MDYFIVAPGPSLTAEDAELVHQWRHPSAAWSGPDRRVIAVNCAFRVLPWADLLYSGDAGWWREYDTSSYRGEMWTASPSTSLRLGINLLAQPILTNSGANAIMFASRLGARRIYLTGFDYGAAEDGTLHCHADHPLPLHNTGEFNMAEMERLAAALRHQGVEVRNYSRRSAIPCLGRFDLDRLLDLEIDQPRPFDVNEVRAGGG